ncbi:hypothetical protein JCM3775_001967 [Rhodotorula graminis]|uniref:Uncharacterized protein n=1 Tax=Rhodotorula graminis (strain WP1) TaxID=578459 RepID=A0A194S4V9_RHOGW|nr:uncharacterized protein RHOBADRAFT_52801 [Rhodotorula graminis WP1]KPV75773.1 hypothetical protein RHOBADRAFT_52801 [Rhodotorula graminis WP1]
MRLSLFAAVCAAVVPQLVSATYFTSPTAGTVWGQATGQRIAWHYQPGGAPRGDIILALDTANPKAAQTLVVATDVDLTSESVVVPADLGSRRASRWILRMVNSNNYDTVYTQVADVIIESFAGSAAPSASAAPSTTAGSGGAVGNGSGDDTATNPAVGRPTSSSSSQRPSSTSSSQPEQSSSSSSDEPSSTMTDEPSSTSSPSSTQLVTATVLSTASGVLVTLEPSTTSGDPVSVVTVTASGSVGQASAVQGGSTSGARGSSGERWVGALGAAAAVAVAYLL